ncbi:MAG: 2-phospho-L-lactate guanylyltransferase, partial [Dermatophilaceae bacterium]
MTDARVVAVVPVKRLAAAKSRVRLPADQRETLAFAFALDTLDALTASPVVAATLVVTSDLDVVSELRRMDVEVVPDDTAGLHNAVEVGIAAATRRWPDLGIAVVPADLPTLRPVDVEEVVGLAEATGGAFVPDHEGTGTTIVVHPSGRSTATRYGPSSAIRHRQLGLTALDHAPPRARLDVDTLEDLDVALTLGVGSRTAAAVAA